MHTDIEHVRDSRMGEPSGELGLRCDLFEALPPRAVEHNLLLEAVGSRSHREEGAPHLAVANRTQEPVRSQSPAFRQHRAIVGQLLGFVAFPAKANVLQCEPCVRLHTKEEQRGGLAAAGPNGFLKCRAADL